MKRMWTMLAVVVVTACMLGTPAMAKGPKGGGPHGNNGNHYGWYNQAARGNPFNAPFYYGYQPYNMNYLGYSPLNYATTPWYTGYTPYTPYYGGGFGGPVVNWFSY